MRQTMQDMQRHSESLSAELAKQSESNQELSRDLRVEKEGREQALHKVKQQAEELATLQRLRNEDEARMGILQRKHTEEVEMIERDFHRKLATAEEEGIKRAQTIQSKMTDKLALLVGRLQDMKKEVIQLRTEHAGAKKAIQSYSEDAVRLVQQAERSVVNRVDALSRRHLELQVSNFDATHALEMKLAAEQDHHLQEATNWNHQLALLTAEKDDLFVQHKAEVDQLQLQLQEMERARDEQRTQVLYWQKKQEEVCGEKEEALRRLETTQQDLSHCEGEKASHEAEAAMQQQAVEDLRLKAQEARDELRSSGSTIESLRLQLQEQQRCIAEEREAAVSKLIAEVAHATKAGEQRLQRESDERGAEVAAASQRAKEAEEECASVKIALAAASEELARANGSLKVWEGSLADLRGSKASLEADLETVRRQLMDEQTSFRLQLEKLQKEKDHAAAEVTALHERCAEHVEQSAAKDSLHVQRAENLEAAVNDRDAQIQGLQSRHSEAQEQIKELTSELSVHKNRSIELQATVSTLSEDLQEERRRLEEERRRVDEAVGAHVRSMQDKQEQYEQWREGHMASLKQTQEDSLAKLAAVERERAMSDSELAFVKKKLTETEAQLTSTKLEVEQSRGLLAENQSGFTAFRQARAKEEEEANQSKLQLQAEVQRLSLALEAAVRDHQVLQQQLEESGRQYEREKQQIEKDTLEVDRVSKQQLVEKDQAIDRARADFEERVRRVEVRYSGELERERTRLQDVLRENEQLRQFLSEHRTKSSMSVSSLQSQLETHIAKLQQHTTELRGDAIAPPPRFMSAGNLLRAQTPPPGAGLSMRSPPPRAGVSDARFGGCSPAFVQQIGPLGATPPCLTGGSFRDHRGAHAPGSRGAAVTEPLVPPCTVRLGSP